jgi:hypothetical protein
MGNQFQERLNLSQCMETIERISEAHEASELNQVEDWVDKQLPLDVLFPNVASSAKEKTIETIADTYRDLSHLVDLSELSMSVNSEEVEDNSIANLRVQKQGDDINFALEFNKSRLADTMQGLEQDDFDLEWDLRRTMAHELYHVPLIFNFPQVVTGEAIEIALKATSQEKDERWLKSRNELAADLFALRYLKEKPVNLENRSRKDSFLARMEGELQERPFVREQMKARSNKVT